MKSKPKSPIWPYLGILACLFVLSVTAPRAWDRMARDRALEPILIAHKSRVPERPATKIRVEQARVASEPAADVPALGAESAARDRISSAAEMTPSPTSAAPTDGHVSDAMLGPRGEAELPESRDLSKFVVSPPFEYAAPPAPVDETPATDSALAPPVVDTTVESDAAEPEPAPAAQPEVKSRWPVPRALVAQLHRLAEVHRQATWTADAQRLIEKLCAQPERDPAAVEILGQLRAVGRHTEKADGKADRAVEIERARARYALARWIEIWDAALAWESATGQEREAKTSSARLLTSLAEVENLTRKGSVGADWRKYLQLDRLRALADAKTSEAVAERRMVAQTVLDRLAPTRLTTAQRKFVAAEPLASFVEQLRPWAADSVPAAQILEDIERYEHSALASDAKQLARDWHGLSNAAPTEAQAVSRTLDVNYRNANVRAAVTNELLNRLMPQPKPVKGAVRDTVLDVPVHGCSTTFTKLSVRLVPDDRVMRLKIEGDGRVSSDTVATSGPASFRSQAQSLFQVQKPVTIGPQGMTVWPAEAKAENDYDQLVAMETQFDGVPLFGSLVRSIARNRHDESHDDAMAEVGQKVALRAREQFDREVKPHLASAAEKIQTRQAAAIERLGLELVPVAMSSTEERLVARMRLGSPGQLGGHTPRPQAPSNSWFSLQIHQSALNNVFEKLDLDGRAFTLPELFSWIGEKLNREEWASREDLPEGVRMKFAAKDAVRVRAESGRMMVTFSFAELAQGRNRWRDFAVRTYYKPEAEGLDARFTRDPDDTIHLEGKSVRGIQVALRTIFSKVLSRNRDLHLVTETFTKDERLQDLEVSQYVVEDGWIGLAYSPKRAAGNVARKPSAVKK